MASRFNVTLGDEIFLKKRGYCIKEILRRGDYSNILQVEIIKSTVKKKNAACKIIDITRAPTTFLKKFLPRELNILTKVKHPNIIWVHNILKFRVKYFILMDLAVNGDLLEYLMKSDFIEEEQARIWIRQIAVAVQYLHELKIAHRDLKCENILLTDQLNAMVSDFGFARFTTDESGKSILSGTFCGSMAYTAPEIIKGTPYNPLSSDVWSLGCILFVVLNKSMPFNDSHIKVLYGQQLTRRIQYRSTILPRLSMEVRSLLHGTLEPNVDNPSKSLRFTISQVIEHDWFKRDPRTRHMTSEEAAALKDATEIAKSAANIQCPKDPVKEADGGLTLYYNLLPAPKAKTKVVSSDPLEPTEKTDDHHIPIQKKKEKTKSTQRRGVNAHDSKRLQRNIK